MAKTQWQRAAEAGVSGVYLPAALDRKKPGEEHLLTWYWLFPAREVSRDPRSDVVRRHHAANHCASQAGR